MSLFDPTPEENLANLNALRDRYFEMEDDIRALRGITAGLMHTIASSSLDTDPEFANAATLALLARDAAARLEDKYT